MDLRRICSLALIALLLLAVPGCGTGAAPVPEPTRRETPEPTRTPRPLPLPLPLPIPEATAAPTPEPGPAEKLLAGMSLREQLCQLLILRPSDLTPAWPVAGPDARLAENLGSWPVGGFFLDTGNMTDGEQLLALNRQLTAGLSVPPLILCDEEGGVVSRLGSTVGSLQLRSMYHYRDQGEETARNNARAIGEELLRFGLNADLAPVADVWSNPANTVIRYRAYSDDFTQAAGLVAAAVEGFHMAGVACCLKHFPGHGDTEADSHYGSVYVTRSLEELRERELLPFRAGIGAGADMVMVGHLILTELGEEPAPFSYAVVTELLRQELGFSGVVITDALEMGALGDYTPGERVVKAIQAGVDLLLCPGDPKEALAALEAAVEAGELTEERIRESVLRVLELKLARGILPSESTA